MNTQDPIAALTEACLLKDDARVAATGPMRWTLSDVEYTTTGRFSWDPRLDGWLIKGSIGTPATPEYQMVFISVDAADPDQPIDKQLRQGDDGLVFTYSQTQSGGIFIQQPSGSVSLQVDLAHKAFSGSFEAQVKVGAQPALVSLSGSFSLAT